MDAADELTDLGFAITEGETGKTNDVDSRLIATNRTSSCNFSTCCKCVNFWLNKRKKNIFLSHAFLSIKYKINGLLSFSSPWLYWETPCSRISCQLFSTWNPMKSFFPHCHPFAASIHKSVYKKRERGKHAWKNKDLVTKFHHLISWLIVAVSISPTHFIVL